MSPRRRITPTDLVDYARSIDPACKCQEGNWYTFSTVQAYEQFHYFIRKSAEYTAVIDKPDENAIRVGRVQ